MPLSSRNLPLPRPRLAMVWAVIGFVLLGAAIAQPIVASQLSAYSAQELLAPMQRYAGGRPMPDEVVTLFAGMFANIEFSLVFSALKASLGAAVLFCVHHFRAGRRWAARALSVISALGIGAFASMGFFFAYSAVVIARAIELPILPLVFMVLSGGAVAGVFAVVLWRHFRSFAWFAAAEDQDLGLNAPAR